MDPDLDLIEPPVIAVRDVRHVSGFRATHRPGRWCELRRQRISGALAVQLSSPRSTLELTGDEMDGSVKVTGELGTVLVDICWSAVRDTIWAPPLDLPAMRVNS